VKCGASFPLQHAIPPAYRENWCRVWHVELHDDLRTKILINTDDDLPSLKKFCMSKLLTRCPQFLPQLRHTLVRPARGIDLL